MKGNLLVYILLLFCCVHTSAQTVEIVGEVEDCFSAGPSQWSEDFYSQSG